MANAAKGRKQKSVPKKTDKKESERFVATARELAADESPEAFERTFEKLVPAKHPPEDR